MLVAVDRAWILELARKTGLAGAEEGSRLDAKVLM